MKLSPYFLCFFLFCSTVLRAENLEQIYRARVEAIKQAAEYEMQTLSSQLEDPSQWQARLQAFQLAETVREAEEALAGLGNPASQLDPKYTKRSSSGLLEYSQTLQERMESVGEEIQSVREEIEALRENHEGGWELPQVGSEAQKILDEIIAIRSNKESTSSDKERASQLRKQLPKKSASDWIKWGMYLRKIARYEEKISEIAELKTHIEQLAEHKKQTRALEKAKKKLMELDPANIPGPGTPEHAVYRAMNQIAHNREALIESEKARLKAQYEVIDRMSGTNGIADLEGALQGRLGSKGSKLLNEITGLVRTFMPEMATATVDEIVDEARRMSHRNDVQSIDLSLMELVRLLDERRAAESSGEDAKLADLNHRIAEGYEKLVAQLSAMKPTFRDRLIAAGKRFAIPLLATVAGAVAPVVAGWTGVELPDIPFVNKPWTTLNALMASGYWYTSLRHGDFLGLGTVLSPLFEGFEGVARRFNPFQDETVQANLDQARREHELPSQRDARDRVEESLSARSDEIQSALALDCRLKLGRMAQ